MNLDELRTVQAKERQKDGLQHLRETFYADVGEYLGDLKAERDRAAAKTEQPFADPEVQHLTDEIETVEGVVEAIYERRMGKLVKRASLAAAGMSADRDGLTAEERELFDEIVETIQANKETVLDALSGNRTRRQAEREGAVPDEVGGTAGDGADDEGSSEPAGDAEDGGAIPPADAGSGVDGPAGDAGSGTETTGDDPTDEGGGSDAGEEPTDDGDGVDRTTVRITAEVGEILGVDEREYHLEAEDVVTLPTANAEGLIERDAAERLE